MASALSTTIPAHLPARAPAEQRSSLKRRRISDDELKRNLQLLASISRPLSPTLPPSPPQSRSSSPPPQKRRKENTGSSTSSTPNTAAKTSPKKSAAADPMKSSPTSPAKTISPAASSSTAVSPHPNTIGTAGNSPDGISPPPKRERRHLSSAVLHEMYNQGMADARRLKKSSEKRTNKPNNTPRQHFIARLELTHSVLAFLYSFWCSDESRKTVNPDGWHSTNGILHFCRSHWKKHAVGPRQKAFEALLTLIEGCVGHRIAMHSLRILNHNTRALKPSLTPSASHQLSSGPTPPSHVPSPATSNSSPPASHSTPSPSLPSNYLDTVMSDTTNTMQSSRLMMQGHEILSPNLLSRLFPLTFAKGVESTLTMADGIDVDPEECGAGRGTWASPVLHGDGIVHLIGFARFMIWELAEKEGNGGYRGLDGVDQEY